MGVDWWGYVGYDPGACHRGGDSVNAMDNKTVQDFGDQWTNYTANEGWYASTEMFRDIVGPLLDTNDLKGRDVAEIGSGTGRIVGMLLALGVKHVWAVEPSEGYAVLSKNLEQMDGGTTRVTALHGPGETFVPEHRLDCVFAIGVLHHIREPSPVVKAAYDALVPGGCFFAWLYGREGNELYLRIIRPIRAITTRLPHVVLRVIVDLAYGALCGYRMIGKVAPVPLRAYIERVLWPMTPKVRRLVIYDQLNPAYAKYYTREDAENLLKRAGFVNVQSYHRHGYSWSVIGRKPHTG